jgi:hypothetical protein
MKNLFSLRAVFSGLLGGLAFWAHSALAQSTISPNATCDVILGFQVITLSDTNNDTLPAQGIGSGEDLEVDLGSVSKFYDATSGSSFTLPGLALADLVSTYGSNWDTRTDLVWGIIATTGRSFGSEIYSNGVGTADGYAPAKTVWATKAESTPGVQSTPWANSLSLSLPIAQIEPLYLNGSPLAGATSTTSSTEAADIASSGEGSWTSQDYHSGSSNSFGFFPGTIDNSTDIPGSGYAISDFYQVNPSSSGSAALLGDFKLSGSGTLSYQSEIAAVPEPSIMTTLLLGAGLLVTLARRRDRRLANRS